MVESPTTMVPGPAPSSRPIASPTRAGAPHQSWVFHDADEVVPPLPPHDVRDRVRHGPGERAEGVAVEVDQPLGQVNRSRAAATGLAASRTAARRARVGAVISVTGAR